MRLPQPGSTAPVAQGPATSAEPSRRSPWRSRRRGLGGDGRARYRVAFVVYATVVTTVSAALVARQLYGPMSLVRALAWQAVVYVSWGALVPLLAVAVGRSRRSATPWWASLPALALLAVPVVLGHAGLTVWATRVARGRPLGGGVWADVLERLPVDLLIYTAIVAALVAEELYARLGERQRAAEALAHEATRAHLHALQLQLRPHFLFNTLQALVVLIRRDPDAAVQMTMRLAELLRRTVDAPGAQVVPLTEELSMARAYLDIVAVRFRDRLRTEFAVADDVLGTPVPEFLLQPLIENALQHGVEQRPGPGCIRIAARRVGGAVEVTVEDDGAGLPPTWRDGDADGVGLGATRARLRHLYGGDDHLTVARRPEGGTCVRVVVPQAGAGGPA